MSPSAPNTPSVGICYLTSILKNDHSGTEGHLIRLVRALDREQFDPHLVVLQDSRFIDAWSDPTVPMRSLGYRSLHDRRSLQRLRAWTHWLAAERIQILECHSPEAQFVGSCAARVAGVPAVLSSRRNLGYNYDWKARFQLRITNRFVDRFVANSQVVVEQRSASEGVDPSRFALIYNGVDLERFDRAAASEVSDDFAAACAQGVVVSVAANLRPVKNLAMFLRAAKRVIEGGDRAHFALLGAGEDEASLKALARDLGIGPRVLFLGPKVPIAPYLKGSDIGCLSSHSEGFSNAIVEYMTAELPVVATAVGGAAEAIVDGETGFLVAAGDDEAMATRLRELIRDKEKRRRMGAKGRARVAARFSHERQIRDHEALYNELLRSEAA